MTTWEINQPSDATVLDVPTDILTSYHYFSNSNMAQIASWGTRIIGDSGAFSAMTSGKPIDREQFHEWAHRWRDSLFWTAALDVIGDPDATFENWQAARRDGLELVPSVHYGEGTAALDRLAEEGATLIGLGGMVPYSSEKDRLMRWCLQMHRHARDHHPHVRFHGWGISHPYLVDNLPWWSTDSSGFSSCFRFGTLRLFDPRKGRFLGVDLNGRDLAKHARLVREHYGADWRDLAESTLETRRALGRVALRAVQLYAAWLQKRQTVTAPALLAEKVASAGPLQVPAVAFNEAIDAVSIEGRAGLRRVGPLQAGAMGMPQGAQGYALTPDGRPISARGPESVAAMGAPEMQPIKALSPSDSSPDRYERIAP